MTKQPTPPAPVRLVKIEGGRYPRYQTPDGRFTVTRNRPDRDTCYEDSGFAVVDTAARNILGHGHSNTVRVFEIEDAKAMIAAVLRVEYLARVQAWSDAERRAMGLPTVVEAAQARMREDRASLPAVRAEQ
jgi:hypothetical protein